MAGLWSTALGWGENELADAAAEQMRKLSYGHVFAGKSHEPAIALAEKLKELSPFPVGKVFFGQLRLGSQRHPDQVRLVCRQCRAAGPRRRKSSARQKAYHGVTIASASLTGLAANHKSFDLPLDFARHADMSALLSRRPAGRERAGILAAHGRRISTR